MCGVTWPREIDILFADRLNAKSTCMITRFVDVVWHFISFPALFVFNQRDEAE